MKPADTNYIVIAKFGSAFGVHGWIKVRAYTEFGDSILDYLPWSIQRKNDWQTLEVEDHRLQGDQILVKLREIHTPEEARFLTGTLIGIKRSQLPLLEKNEYYWSDLVGLTVINQHQEPLGKVIYLMETGSNDVLVVKGDKEYAIPYLPGSVIIRVDLEQKEIHVNWELI